MAEDIDDEVAEKESGAVGTETPKEGEDSDGEGVLSGTEQDDEAGTGSEDEGADAGEGSEAEGDDDQQEEVAAPKEKAPALKAAPATKAAPAQKAAPVPEPPEDDDPEIKPLVERRAQMGAYIKQVETREKQYRDFLNNKITLDDGVTKFGDLEEGDKNYWRSEHQQLLADKKAADRALAAHDGTLSAKRVEVGESRAFVRSVGKLTSTMDSTIATLGELTEEQEDAVRGFMLRKANSSEGYAFFNRPEAQITADLKARLGAAPKPRNAVIKGAPKKAPPPVVNGRTSGGAPGAESKAVKGLTSAEEATLQRINPQMLNLLKKGQVPVASVKAVLADHLPKGGKK